MTQNHLPEQLTADELAIFRTDALLDAIIDGRPWTGPRRPGVPARRPLRGRPASRPPTHRGPTHQLGAHRPGARPCRGRGPAPGPAVERRRRLTGGGEPMRGSLLTATLH